MTRHIIRSCAPWIAAVAGAALLGSVEPVHTQGQSRGRMWAPRLSAPAPGDVQVVPVQGNVYMVVGAGANITVQAGRDGLLLVDTGVASMSAKVLQAVRTISTGPLRYIINTSHYEQYTGGNEAIAAAGEIIPWRDANYAAGPQGALGAVKKASVISYYTVFHRMAAPTGQTAPTPEGAWPDNTYSTPWKRLSFNDEPVVIENITGSTDGNSVVLFRKSDVLSVGSLLDLTAYPRIDLKAGGSIHAMVDALNRLIGIAVPAASGGGGTLVVPGNGRIADHAEIAYYRDMLTIVRDRLQDMITKGMTLEQAKAARPTREWDTRYGSESGAWTTSMFVEAAYASLKARSS